MIVSYCKNKGIGYQNTIPWNIKEDMKSFSSLTQGTGNNAIIMGKYTWDSLPHKPLKNRYNIVLSRTLSNIDNPNVKVISNTNEALQLCKDKQFDALWVIGGTQVYKKFMTSTKYLYVTYIDKEYMCDAFFPDIPDYFKLKEIKPFLDNAVLHVYYNSKMVD